MSHLHVRRLALIRYEFQVTRLAVHELEIGWSRRDISPEHQQIRLYHVQETARNLEGTYIVRLFSEFEAVLQEHLTQHIPSARLPGTAQALINRIARLRRLPDAIRDGAHTAREHRNGVVHQILMQSAPPRRLTFAQAQSALNRFLTPLPD